MKIYYVETKKAKQQEQKRGCGSDVYTAERDSRILFMTHDSLVSAPIRTVWTLVASRAISTLRRRASVPNFEPASEADVWVEGPSRRNAAVR